LLYDTALSLLAKTGMRVGELCNLRIEDLGLKNKHLKIRESKTRQQRLIPLPPELVKPISQLVAKRLPDDYVFISVTRHSKLPTQLINQELTTRAKQAGITKRVYPHLLRHSFITELLRQDISVLKIQRLVGHQDIRSIMDYCGLLFEDLKESLYRHPLIRKHRNPYEILDAIKKDIKSYHLEEDKRLFYELTEGNEGIRVNIFIR